MIVLAKGSVTKPDALAPYIDDEMRVVEKLKAEGVLNALYRRAAGPEVYLLLEGSSIDADQRALHPDRGRPHSSGVRWRCGRRRRR